MVSGQETLDKIINLAVDANDKPLQPVLISRCGELEKKGKQKQKQPAVKDSAVSTDSRDRGRRRRSGDSDVDMSASPNTIPVGSNIPSIDLINWSLPPKESHLDLFLTSSS